MIGYQPTKPNLDYKLEQWRMDCNIYSEIQKIHSVVTLQTRHNSIHHDPVQSSVIEPRINKLQDLRGFFNNWEKQRQLSRGMSGRALPPSRNQNRNERNLTDCASKPPPSQIRLECSRMRCREPQPWGYKLQPYNNTHSRTIAF